MGDAQSCRADCSAPTARRAAAEGLEDPLACGEEGWCVYLSSLNIVPSFPRGRDSEKGGDGKASSLLFMRAAPYSLLCCVWPAWTSCAGQPTWHGCQDLRRCHPPRWLRQSALRWHPFYGCVSSINPLSLRAHVNSSFFFSLKNNIHSSTATEVDQQGVGRGYKRARKGTQNQPYHRSVIPSYVSFAMYRSCAILLLTMWRWHAGISSEGYSGKGFVTHK